MAVPTLQNDAPEGTKRCGRCRRVFPLDEFVSDRKGPVLRCGDCRQYGRDAYARRRPKRARDGRLVPIGQPSGDVKACTVCHETKPVEAFGPLAAGAGGRNSRCRPCANAEWQKLYAEGRFRNPVVSVKARRLQHLRYWYGLTGEQYEAMVAAQGGLCAICNADKPGGRRDSGYWYVDHDHGTGSVRGLLCRACNFAIGQMNDDPAALRRAADYLEHHARRRLSVIDGGANGR